MTAGAGVEELVARHAGAPLHVPSAPGGAGVHAGAAVGAAALRDGFAGRQLEVREHGRQAHGGAELGRDEQRRLAYPAQAGAGSRGLVREGPRAVASAGGRDALGGGAVPDANNIRTGRGTYDTLTGTPLGPK